MIQRASLLIFTILLMAGDIIPLPSFVDDGEMTVGEAIRQRRSIRDFTDETLELADVGKLLYAAYGISDTLYGFHTAPSAGALFPMEIFLHAENVTGLEPGIYKYVPAGHGLSLVSEGSYCSNFKAICNNQRWVGAAQINIVIFANYDKTTSRYGQRGVGYVFQESGHIGQNIYLQATSLGLGAVAIGAFDSQALRELLGIDTMPIYILSVGKPVRR